METSRRCWTDLLDKRIDLLVGKTAGLRADARASFPATGEQDSPQVVVPAFPVEAPRAALRRHLCVCDLSLELQRICLP